MEHSHFKNHVPTFSFILLADKILAPQKKGVHIPSSSLIPVSGQSNRANYAVCRLVTRR